MDLLKHVGVPEVAGVVGHSVGELGCAYADGALAAEQTVLAAYWRGRAVQEATLPPGAMAAVGMYKYFARIIYLVFHIHLIHFI